jgi:nucleoside-diphosphate-sugar epimerase
LKVLVAGGAGFIGSHLCARLLAEGHHVLCLDNLLTGSERNLAALLPHPAFRFERRDVSAQAPTSASDPLDDAAGDAAGEGEEAVDAIFHLASPASPVGYLEHPFETIQANTQGTRLLLDRARRSGARFLMASTSEAYGDPLVHPQPESYFGNVNPIGPRACYDESKRLGETLTAEYQRQLGLDTRIVRIFNTYGPHSQLHDGRLVPNFIVQALAGQPLTIHGDGQQTRSLCYVDDLVEGLLRAQFAPQTRGEVFNLGNPEEHTVREWAEHIVRLCGSRSGLISAPKREDDPERRQPDIAKAQRVLGWTPTISPEVGLHHTIEWFRTELERGQ